MSSDISKIKDKALPILKEAGVIRSSIFGSFARGEETEESDVDLLIEPPKGMSLLDLVGLEMTLKEALGREVDVHTYRSVSPYLKKYIQDQIQIL